MSGSDMTPIRYRPRDGLRIPISGSAGLWPDTGRPIDPGNAYHTRLIAQGDLVPIYAAPKRPANGSRKRPAPENHMTGADAGSTSRDGDL